MELILISDSKLKIMLSQKDMIKYDLCCDNIDYSNTKTRRAFWNIFDEARQRTGFDAAQEKIFVQVFPMHPGGCEIFVTRLDKNSADKDKELQVDVSRQKKKTLYRFSHLEHLITVCHILKVKGYTDESAAFYDENSFYLVLSEEYKFIGEYAEMRENKNYIYHVLEHCSGICAEGAVETLASLR